MGQEQGVRSVPDGRLLQGKVLGLLERMICEVSSDGGECGEVSLVLARSDCQRNVEETRQSSQLFRATKASKVWHL